MVSGSLVRDKESNLKAVGLRKAGKYMEYEFVFPYRNEDLGDSLWQAGKAYQIAILVGSSEGFKGVNGDTWMSDQIYIRLGSPSKDSIYHPPYLAEAGKDKHHGHSNGAKHGQKGKKK
jgi:hypothetical protein